MTDENGMLMSDKEMRKHMEALFIHFERSGLDPEKACAVMGNMICHMIIGLEGRRSFITTLSLSWDLVDSQRSGTTPTQH